MQYRRTLHFSFVLYKIFALLLTINDFRIVSESKSIHPLKRMRGQATNWVRILAKDISGKGLLSKVYRELIRLNNKKMKDPNKKWTKVLNMYVIKIDIQMANKKRYLTSKCH